jgi:hypothetical protein
LIKGQPDGQSGTPHSAEVVDFSLALALNRMIFAPRLCGGVLSAAGRRVGRRAVVELAAEWPFDSDEVLAALPRWGWTMSAYGQRHHPDLLVAHYRMDDYVDVFVSRGHDRCGAYRARLWPGQDPVDAYGVTWCVTGDLSTGCSPGS